MRLKGLVDLILVKTK